MPTHPVAADPRADWSDDRLIEAVLAGESGHFEWLVRRHQTRLYTAMYHVTGSCEEAEDVVQEAMIKAFTKLASFQRNSQFFTWLYRIAFNVSASRRRRKRPNVSLEHYRDTTGEDVEASLDDVDRGLLRDEDIEKLRAALHELSENHRTILILREMQDHSYEDIAEMLEISIGTVRSRLNRARAALKMTLERGEEAAH